MREGVGVQQSLAWVAARFAQRAVEDFFDGGQHREFVIDSLSAIEFAAKAVVASNDVNDLFSLDEDVKLTEAQRMVLDPKLSTDKDRPVGEARAEAMNWLLHKGITISAAEAVRKAGKSLVIDIAAADRLIKARNAAAHLGDIDVRDVDKLARDFLKVCIQLWAGLNHSEDELWGDLAPIADLNYMKETRTPERDAEVRVVRSKRAFHGLGLSGNRRSGLTFADASVRCPACGQKAIITTQPVGSAPPRCIPLGSRELRVEVLDCPVCGLILFGVKQIKWAERANKTQVSTY